MEDHVCHFDDLVDHCLFGQGGTQGFSNPHQRFFPSRVGLPFQDHRDQIPERDDKILGFRIVRLHAVRFDAEHRPYSSVLIPNGDGEFAYRVGEENVILVIFAGIAGENPGTGCGNVSHDAVVLMNIERETDGALTVVVARDRPKLKVPAFVV